MTSTDVAAMLVELRELERLASVLRRAATDPAWRFVIPLIDQRVTTLLEAAALESPDADVAPAEPRLEHGPTVH